MATKPKQPPGPAMTLGNMRQVGVERLIASCLDDACRLVDVSGYPADTEDPWLATVTLPDSLDTVARSESRKSESNQ